MENPKWWSQVSDAIDKFWQDNHYPPTLRDLMGMTGITSTSFMRYITHRLPGIRITAGGHPVPDWVDQAIEREKE